MSTQTTKSRGPEGPGRGPMSGMFGPPPSKSKDFRGSLKRLLTELGPERKILTLVLGLITTSVVIGSFGPKILGRATNYVFYGFLGRRIPAGVTKAQAIAGLRAQGQNRLADMLQKSSVVPGKGIDFHAVYHVLVLALALYVVSSLFMWLQGYLMAGITQRTVFRLRRLAEEKLGRLPLSYFDTQSRGDLLSRVTNPNCKTISTRIHCSMGLDRQAQWACGRNAHWACIGEGFWKARPGYQGFLHPQRETI